MDVDSARFDGTLWQEDSVVVGCVPIERRCNVQRVPTTQQVHEFLRCYPFGSKWHAFYSLMFFAGLRPKEVCDLTTDMVMVDRGRWVGLTYPVCKSKPPGMAKRGEPQKRAVRKWNRIHESTADIPVGALRSLQHYWTFERQQFGQLFPKCYTYYRNAFAIGRRKMIAAGHTNWASTSADYYSTLWGLRGKKTTEFDIGPYSGRRFFVSAYHWLITPINGVPDLVQTQRRMAHSGSKDTAVYVHSHRAIGLMPEQIGRGWAVLAGSDPNQQRLNEWWSTD